MPDDIHLPRQAVSPAEDKKSNTKADRKADVAAFIGKAMSRFKIAAEASAKSREESLDDLKFITGEQWPNNIKNDRGLDGRPALTINRCPTIIRQVTNQEREKRPATQVNPVGGGADQDTAEVLQGIIRHIEVQSEGEIAYDDAFESMVGIGFGYWRIYPEFINDPDGHPSFDQELKIARVKNPFCVYFDPACVQPDYSDANYCFVIEDLTKDEFKDAYPDAELSGLTDMQSIGDSAPNWVSQDTIRVAEYFYVETKRKKIYLLASGKIVDSLEDVPEGQNVINSRDMEVRQVEWAKINAVEILEETDPLPIDLIPVIPVIGDDKDVNGKRYLAGLIRPAKDAMRMYNYQVSSATETVALQPRAPYIVYEGQIAGFEKQWEQANIRNFSVLTVKSVTVDGKPAPIPQRSTAEAPIQATMELLRQADNDTKGTTGIFDANLGQPGPEQSAKAILARQNQGNLSTSNWGDNLARSLRHSGRVLVKWIPHIYDAPRVQRIINPDQKVDQVGVINSVKSQMSKEQARQLPEMMGVKQIYDIGVGRYDITMGAGQSYASKRQEAVATMMALVQTEPTLVGIIGDLMVGQMDIPLAKEIAARLKKMLPPQLQDDDDDDPEAKLAKAQSTLQQMGQQHQALMAEVQKLSQMVETKQVEQQGKMAIEKLHADTQITIAEIQTKAQSGTERAQMFVEVWKELHGDAHEVATQAAAQQHDQTMAAQQGQQDQQAQESDQAHEAEQATQAQAATAQQSQAQETADSQPSVRPLKAREQQK